MKFAVRLIEDAEADMRDIYQYVLENDSAESAIRLLQKIEETMVKLETMPARGHVPPELERVGVMDFREVHFKPFRIIYEIRGTDVFVHCVLDGRRDLQELLYRRMLR